MKNNKDQLQQYKKQKDDYEQKEKKHREAYNAWWQEVNVNGDWTEKADVLGLEYDKATSDLDISRVAYNFLAHEALKVYMLKDPQFEQAKVCEGDKTWKMWNLKKRKHKGKEVIKSQEKDLKNFIYELEELYNEGYRWIARCGYWDINGVYFPEHGRLEVYKEKPVRHSQDYWYSKTACGIYDNGLLYPKISWDNDPYELSCLIKIKD